MIAFVNDNAWLLLWIFVITGTVVAVAAETRHLK